MLTQEYYPKIMRRIWTVSQIILMSKSQFLRYQIILNSAWATMNELYFVIQQIDLEATSWWSTGIQVASHKNDLGNWSFGLLYFQKNKKEMCSDNLDEDKFELIKLFIYNTT